MFQAPATTAPSYWFSSPEARNRFAEQYGELIVKMLKSTDLASFDSRDAVVRMASAYIEGMYDGSINRADFLPPPDLRHPATMGEAHFTLWAHTATGRYRVMPWVDFVGSVYVSFKAPRFLREILTRGTRLHSEWRSGGFHLTGAQNLAVVVLRSEDPVLGHNAIVRSVHEHYHYSLSEGIVGGIEEFLMAQEDCFDQDFPVTKINGKGEPLFTLPPGVENKIFMPWYDLGQIGYHDIPDWPAASTIASQLATDLPAELRLMILESVFKINGDIHVVFDHDEDEYVFIVEREQHLKEYPLGLAGVEMPRGNFWKLPTLRNFFAFGATGEGNRAMMMHVFHKNNFIMHDD